ncbi:MAG: 2-C-methyl-D-erythritol 4-phosphate cytidylyltransferase [Waddliaceae bacterium]|nr:2-C-methyl-D-erythritol 4-phosphate cytidylyltransferase [Waddliaceae bacterium]
MNQSILKTSAILLAGGQGARLGSEEPKQFLNLGDKRVVEYSLELFDQSPDIHEIILVCPQDFRESILLENYHTQVVFADPGLRRQDSVYSGFLASSKDSELLCIHDAARPFLAPTELSSVIQAGSEYGAAVLGTAAKNTIKKEDGHGFVEATLDRSMLWEIQTPQVIKKSLLEKAFSYCYEHHIEVTDDASLVESIGHQVKIVPGSYRNYKITTPDDWDTAQRVIHEEVRLTY